MLNGAVSHFGKAYAGEPEQIAEDLSQDKAVRSADTLIVAIPNQHGVDYTIRILETLMNQITPNIGWWTNQLSINQTWDASPALCQNHRHLEGISPV